MSRGREDIERDQDPTSQGGMPLPHGRGGAATTAAAELRQQQRSPKTSGSKGHPESRRHREIHHRDRVLTLSDAQLETMRDIGRFRTVGEDDLLRFRYEGNARKFYRDYLNLKSQGLVERWTVSVGKTRKPLPVYTLTGDGKKTLKSAGLDRFDQALYAGFVKPREAAHDAGIYRMFQAEASQIEARVAA